MIRRIQNPDINWKFCRLEKASGITIGEEMPARVPGDVFTDLLENERIPDPYYGTNSKQVQWVNDCDWLYMGSFGMEPRQGERVFLQFMGIDYQSTVGFNGSELARHEGMFSRLLFDVTQAVRENNLIEVKLIGQRNRLVEKIMPPIILETEAIRRRYLKNHMSYGWDFAPRLKGCGIWDDVSVFTTGPAAIEDLWIRTSMKGEVEVEVSYHSRESGRGVLELEVSGETFEGLVLKESVPAAVRAGRAVIYHRLDVRDFKMWWPWDMGGQNLYRLSARLFMGDEVSDSVEDTFAFRRVSFEENPGAPKSHIGWVLNVNGKREYIRGANWVPAESMAGRLKDESYESLVAMAKDANINTLRLWGGGNRERRAFYDACDRLGVMCMQEFPVACIAFLGLPRSKRYLSLLSRECREIVRQLRNRPSVIMWCGGNEFNVPLSRPAIKEMKRVTGEMDPTRRFVPASPFGGDAHNYIVWHMYGNLEDYFSDQGSLFSEFGLQSMPDRGSLERFIPGKLIWPPGAAHRHHNLEEAKMKKYARNFGSVEDLDDFIQSSQMAQAWYMQMAIEHWRRSKYRVSGTLFWQFNEPWPAICWSVVDYFKSPKLAYHRLKDVYNPLLVSAKFEPRQYRQGEDFRASVFLVNDLHTEFRDLAVEIAVTGKLMKSMQADVGPDEVRSLGETDFTLPVGNPPVLELSVRQGDREIARNRYDLSFHDSKRAPLWRRRIFRRWEKMIQGKL